jgi:hypothetical protein
MKIPIAERFETMRRNNLLNLPKNKTNLSLL